MSGITDKRTHLQIKFIRNRFLRNYSYLLLLFLLLIVASFFTKTKRDEHAAAASFAKALQKYIGKSEKDFESISADTAFLAKITSGEEKQADAEKFKSKTQLLFIYKSVGGFNQLLAWNTQTILPADSIVNTDRQKGFVKLANGYYFFQKHAAGNMVLLGFSPVKWEYAISDNYLENSFTVRSEEGKNFDISYDPRLQKVTTTDGQFLFSLKPLSNGGPVHDNNITIILRLLAMVPLFLFIHLLASHLYFRRGLLFSSVFLACTVIVLRVISYFFPVPVLLRQFELFDPAVYGSDVVLRSLGDLLINAVLFFWVINFIKNHLRKRAEKISEIKGAYKWILTAIGVFVILFVTYTGGAIIRSMVADSQISFDVLNFFSLNIYSVIGFLVLCCIATGYYYFCRVIFFFLGRMFPGFMLPLFLAVVVAGLLLLSFRIGNLTGAFELYELLWLMLFLLLIKNDLEGFFSSGLIISRLVFWLFFFSASIAAVIITENGRKELRNRKHYAEMIAAKTEPGADVLLNTQLTEFRTEMLAGKFDLLTGENTSAAFRDSLVNNNLSRFTDKYRTEVLVYDSVESPLYNNDDVSYNSLNTIFNGQTRPTSVPGLYYFDAGYDKFSYITKRVVKNTKGTLLGYVFIIISPKEFTNHRLDPDVFSRGESNSIENSPQYAYAIYENGKMISGRNDYPFSARYHEKDFEGRQFSMGTKNNYSELWYNAGGNKYVLIVKENRVVIELITLFSYLFCSFLLLSAFSWVVSLLLRSRFNIRKIKNEINLSIRQQVHGTVIFFSVVSFIIIGISTILFFIGRYEKNNKETLNRAIRTMGDEFRESVTSEMVQGTIFQNNETTLPSPLEKITSRLSAAYGSELNVYSTSGDLKASSLPWPYVKGIVSLKMDPLAFYHLNKAGEVQYFQKEQIGHLSFASNYIPVTDNAGNDIAYLNIPYFTSQNKLKEEISDFLVTIINLNAFVFLIAGIVALIITNRITRSFSFISDKMKLINLGQHNEAIDWKRNDEIGALVKEYNRMLSKLDESAAILARNERESAWSEMARQVAHEIKNPLTPMRLSMQFLQQAIDNNSPDVKELSARLSKTMVEQIDHLSAIAGEFSRFANIENGKPERFDLNEALLSVKELYAADEKVSFDWKLLQQPVMIYADKTHINRILTNLILNGIQSVPAELHPHIRVEEELDNETVLVKITDNGSGISEDVQSRIFTPNFTTKSSGTGLGLAMCKRMAEQAGGDITYTTTMGEGTTFVVRIPLMLLGLGKKEE